MRKQSTSWEIRISDIHVKDLILYALLLLVPIAFFYAFLSLQEHELRMTHLVAQNLDFISQQSAAMVQELKKRDTVHVFLALLYLFVGYFASNGVGIFFTAPAVKEATILEWVGGWVVHFYHACACIPLCHLVYGTAIVLCLCIVLLALYGVWQSLGCRV